MWSVFPYVKFNTLLSQRLLPISLVLTYVPSCQVEKIVLPYLRLWPAIPEVSFWLPKIKLKENSSSGP